jgi:hypothetical protein
MSYRDDVPRGDGMGRYPGFHLTLPEAKHSTFKPGEKGKTLFRAFPEVQNGVEMPYRAGPDPYNFTYWMRAEKMVRSMGTSTKFTAFTRVKGKDRNYIGPIEKFCYTLTKVFKDTPALVPPSWLNWKLNKGALPRVEAAGLLQGMLFENSGKEYKGEDGRYKPLFPVILTIAKTAREQLEILCNTEVPGYTGAPDDYNKRFSCGDFISCAGGKLLQLTLVPASGLSFAHYTVSITSKQIPLKPELVAQNFKPWDQLLKFLTVEEQLSLLIQEFPPEAIDFVFGQGEWASMLGSGIIGKWDNRNKAPAPVSHQPSTVPLNSGGVISTANPSPATVVTLSESAPWEDNGSTSQDIDGDIDLSGGSEEPVVSTQQEVQQPHSTPLNPSSIQTTASSPQIPSSMQDKVAVAKQRLLEAQKKVAAQAQLQPQAVPV